MNNTKEKIRYAELRHNARVWGLISRGFVEDSTETKEILINGRLVRGYWVYGYIRPRGDLTYIVGGKGINDIDSANNEYLVVNDSVSQCTGLLVPATDGSKKPLFQYDIIKIVEPEEVNNLTVIWDSVRMRWSALDFESSEYLYKLNADLKLEIVGTIFDSEYKIKS